MINKIAILISWPREVDMFSVLIKEMPKDVVVIVDDFTYTDGNRSENAASIIATLNNKVELVLLSKILGKSKYKILVSTGQTYQEKRTLGSFLKYSYSVSAGVFVHKSRLSKFFLKVIGRPLTGDGKNANKFGRYFIEKKIGINTIKYPKGLDVSTVTYPDEKWREVFDTYLCHSNIDMELITKKFNKAVCIKIGYPRYENTPIHEQAVDIIFNEFDDLDISKPILLWMPTIIKFKDEASDNIKNWIPFVSKLLKKNNVIVRPHPKLISYDPGIINDLQKIGFIVDKKKDRNLGVLYQSSDLVFCDYGGSVLSSIYMRKKLVLLNMPGDSKYVLWRKKRKYIDDSVRAHVSAFNIDEGCNLTKYVEQNILGSDQPKRDKLSNLYFGDTSDNRNVVELFSQLIG